MAYGNPVPSHLIVGSSDHNISKDGESDNSIWTSDPDSSWRQSEPSNWGTMPVLHNQAIQAPDIHENDDFSLQGTVRSEHIRRCTNDPDTGGRNSVVSCAKSSYERSLGKGIFGKPPQTDNDCFHGSYAPVSSRAVESARKIHTDEGLVVGGDSLSSIYQPASVHLVENDACHNTERPRPLSQTPSAESNFSVNNPIVLVADTFDRVARMVGALWYGQVDKELSLADRYSAEFFRAQDLYSRQLSRWLHFQYRPAKSHQVSTSLAEEHYDIINTVRYTPAYEISAHTLQRYATSVPAIDRLFEEGYVLNHFPAIDLTEPESPFPPYAQGGRRPLVPASSNIAHPTSETGMFMYRKGVRGARSTLGTAEVWNTGPTENSDLSIQVNTPSTITPLSSWALKVAALEKEWFGDDDEDDGDYQPKAELTCNGAQSVERFFLPQKNCCDKNLEPSDSAEGADLTNIRAGCEGTVESCSSDLAQVVVHKNTTEIGHQDDKYQPFVEDDSSTTEFEAITRRSEPATAPIGFSHAANVRSFVQASQPTVAISERVDVLMRDSNLTRPPSKTRRLYAFLKRQLEAAAQVFRLGVSKKEKWDLHVHRSVRWSFHKQTGTADMGVRRVVRLSR